MNPRMPGAPDLFVGIDGGGTRATAVAIDAGGVERARIEGTAALVRPEDPAAGASTLADLVDRVLRAAGGALPARGLCCALAGAGREPERGALAAALVREGIADRIRITTDAAAAFHDAFGDGPGILLIAGTGSIAWGRTEDGRTARTGGWGALLGDEGSGYALGITALRAAVRAHDGRGEPTRLAELVLAHAGVSAPEELITWSATAGKSGIAALAPGILAAATADAVARSLVAAAARELVGHVAALRRRLEPWSRPPEIVLSGGLLLPGRPLRDLVRLALEDVGAAQILERAVDAARGAAELARAAAGASGAATPRGPDSPGPDTVGEARSMLSLDA